MNRVSISNPCKLYNFGVHKNIISNAVAFSGSKESSHSFSTYFYAKQSEIDNDTKSRAFIPQMSQIDLYSSPYSDLNKFSVYFENKIKNMLGDKSEAEIEKDIEEVSQRTGVEKERVTEVMRRLSSFSGWASLGALEKALKNAGCGVPYDLFHTTKDASKQNARSESFGYLTLNDVMNYISSNKELIKFDKTAPYTLFVDDFQISEINRVKESMPEYYDKLVEKINDGSVKLTIIDGWNAKSSYSDLSQTMFGSSLDLKTATYSIVKEIRDYGTSLDDALNGDTVSSLKKIFGDDVPYRIIKNQDNTENSAATICKNVSSLYPKADEIKAVIETLAENVVYAQSDDDKQLKKVKSLLAEYFDNNAICFSQKRISEEMKNKHYEISERNYISGRDWRDVYFVIPSKGKSFELMTYQYAKVNNINPSQIIYYNGFDEPEKSFCERKPDLNNKTLVILDDIIGTGASLSSSEFKYDYFSRSGLDNTELIFSSLVAMKPGADHIREKAIYSGRYFDRVFPGRVCSFDDASSEDKLVKSKDRILLEKAIGGCGYQDGWACISMPYMLPDNNSNAAGLLFSFGLKENNVHSNKCSYLYSSLKDALAAKIKTNNAG